MAGITRAQAQQHLDTWLAADIAVASGQSYMIGSRRLDRAHALEIRNNVSYWQSMVLRLSRGGGMRVRYGIVG